MTKHITIIATILLCMSLTACGDASQKGRNAAAELRAAWPDTAAVARFATRYAAQRDSLALPGADDSMDDAFIGAMVSNDTLLVVAQLIALDDAHFAQRQGRTLVDALRDGIHTGKSAANHIALAHGLAAQFHRDEAATAMDAAIDERAHGLSMKEQMELYAASCSPQALAEALKADLKNGEMDATEQQQRIELLRSIYDAEQWKAFAVSFGIEK